MQLAIEMSKVRRNEAARTLVKGPTWKLINALSTILIVLCSLISVRPQIIMAGQGDPKADYKIQNVKSTFDRNVDIVKIGKLRSFLPKDTYHLDEVMLLDVASFVRTDVDVYFPADLDVTIYITGPNQKPITVKGKYSVDFANNSFLRTKNALVFRTFKLLVGCKADRAKIPDQVLNSPDLSVVFENNLFQTMTDGCIDISAAQDLELSVELENNNVAVPTSKQAIRTATGRLVSNRLSLKISE